MRKQVTINGSCPVPSPPEQVVMATDASVIGRQHSGAFIATDGTWGIDAGNFVPQLDPCKPSCAEAAELRAVWLGLTSITSTHPLTIYVDSLSVLYRLQGWQKGQQRLPKWYSLRKRAEGNRPTLVHLRDKVGAEAARLTFQHVLGHSGNLLNEAADSLAAIGRNYLAHQYSRAEARRRASSLAASFLLSYMQAQEHTGVEITDS